MATSKSIADDCAIASYVSETWDIGSGAVEGAVRNLVRLRLDGPGMRWGRQRSEYVLHLRCIYLNRQWGDFETYLSVKGVKLPAQPVPMQPHTAKLKDAA